MNQITPQLHRGFGPRFWLAVVAFVVLDVFGYLQPLLRIRQERAYLYQGYHKPLYGFHAQSVATNPGQRFIRIRFLSIFRCFAPSAKQKP